MNRGTSEQRVLRTIRENLAVQHADLGENQAAMQDRVDANVITTAVGGPAGELDIVPDEPAVRRHDREPRGLSDDRRIGAYTTPHELSRAEAFVLFVDDGGD